MSDWIFNRGGRSKLIDWLALDARFDSGLYGLWTGFKSAWNAASNFFALFRLTGFARAANEVTSELATLGTGGIAVMLLLAQPAFVAVETDDWRKTGNYSVTFQDKDGNEVGKRGTIRSDAVPLDEIPDVMIKALLATEDRRFFEHWGVDVLGTFRALVENLKANDVVQGGSSISQQLAKNLFLSSERSLERKVKEAFLALWLESHFSKKEILKLYFDRAYMGGGTFGFEAAAQFYFGKSIRDVTLAESAMLAGLPKAPTRFAPHINLAAARARADEALTNMVQAGFMTEGQVHGARLNPAQPIAIAQTDAPNWFLDWAYEQAQKILDGQPDQVVIARTTVDMSMQRVADAAVTTALAEQGRYLNVKQAALVSMETDGAVRAIVGGRDYGDNQFNRATSALRQPGSSIKPYIYLTALEHGYTPQKKVLDGPVSCGRHSPKNYSGGYSGWMTMAVALAKSVNTIAIKLSFEVGRENVLANIVKLGITGPITKTCTMAIGDGGISLLQHTSGFAHFANGGKSIRPYAILEITSTTGELIYSHERDAPPQRQIFDPQVIADLNFMMGLVITEGTGKAAALDFTTVAGKTGTASGYKDAWFLGYTGKYVTGVWVGNDDLRPMSGVTGGKLPAPIWKTFMSAVHTDIASIPRIPGLLIHPFQQGEMARVASLPLAETVTVKADSSAALVPEATVSVLKGIAERLQAIDVSMDATDAGKRVALDGGDTADGLAGLAKP